MTDAELIARLRSDHPDHLTSAAADRIEAMTAETNEFCDELAVHAEKLAAAEAKLAKAVGALSLCAGHDHDCVSKIQIARTTIAEIKGERHE